MLSAENGFYVAGGMLRSDDPSYVERCADRELYDALLGGEFCYVLTSRIGRRIELTDFSEAEAAPLALGLIPHGAGEPRLGREADSGGRVPGPGTRKAGGRGVAGPGETRR